MLNNILTVIFKGIFKNKFNITQKEISEDLSIKGIVIHFYKYLHAFISKPINLIL